MPAMAWHTGGGACPPNLGLRGTGIHGLAAPTPVPHPSSLALATRKLRPPLPGRGGWSAQPRCIHHTRDRCCCSNPAPDCPATGARASSADRLGYHPVILRQSAQTHTQLSSSSGQDAPAACCHEATGGASRCASHPLSLPYASTPWAQSPTITWEVCALMAEWLPGAAQSTYHRSRSSHTSVLRCSADSR